MKKELTIFAKKRTTSEGRTFHTYLATLTRNDGTELTCAVKFVGDNANPSPDNCPIIIEVEKESMNLAKNHYTKDNGEVIDTYTLWIKEYIVSSNTYVDHSMDEFF